MGTTCMKYICELTVTHELPSWHFQKSTPATLCQLACNLPASPAVELHMDHITEISTYGHTNQPAWNPPENYLHLPPFSNMSPTFTPAEHCKLAWNMPATNLCLNCNQAATTSSICATHHNGQHVHIPCVKIKPAYQWMQHTILNMLEAGCYWYSRIVGSVLQI